MVFSFTPLSLYPRYPLNSRLCGFHILFAWFGEEKNLLPLPGVEPSLLGFTTCKVGTTMIMLTRIPLLEICWFVVRGSYNGRGSACNSIQFNTILIPDLLLLIDILWPLPVSAIERQAYRSWPLFPAYLFIISLFRRIWMSPKNDYLLRPVWLSDRPFVCLHGRTRLQTGEFSWNFIFVDKFKYGEFWEERE
jgi:hypothetical protein